MISENFSKNWQELLKRLPPVGLLAVTGLDFDTLLNPE